MAAPIDVYEQHSGLDPTTGQRMVESNMNGEEKVPTSASLIDNVQEDLIKQDYGMEWLEVEHLIEVPANSEKDDREKYRDTTPVSSQANSNSYEDPLAKDVHRLVNVINNVIQSHSNLSCEGTRVVDYLDFDIFNYEDILSEVRSWSFGAEALIEESMNSLALDTVNIP